MHAGSITPAITDKRLQIQSDEDLEPGIDTDTSDNDGGDDDDDNYDPDTTIDSEDNTPLENVTVQ